MSVVVALDIIADDLLCLRGGVEDRQALGSISRYQISSMVRVGGTLRDDFAGVMNAIISGITSEASEAINTSIQGLEWVTFTLNRNKRRR